MTKLEKEMEVIFDGLELLKQVQTDLDQSANTRTTPFNKATKKLGSFAAAIEASPRLDPEIIKSKNKKNVV